jgi:hypothetical protein
MSKATEDFLKFAFGFISNNHSTSAAAQKLGDGWMISELDEIKSKLDAISRKDLCTSISCLQQGIQRLIIASGDSFKSENPSTSKLREDGEPPQTRALTQQAQCADAVALASAIGKIKRESSERLKSAKHSFMKAGEKACEAFHNAALSTSDRILASKVRIAGGILENVDDPYMAASDCLQYLQELHNVPAIKETFTVHLEGGIKFFFNKDLREELVTNITTMNLLLADFISKFTNRRMGVFDWPMIECGRQIVHPIHYAKESVEKMREMEITPPWDIVKFKKPIGKIFEQSFAIDCKESLLRVLNHDYRPQKLDRTTGEWRQPFCLSSSDDKRRYSRFVTIDDDDKIYVLSFEYGTDNAEDTLIAYSSDGTIIHYCCLYFPKEGVPSVITMTKDKNIIFCSFKGLGCTTGTLYIYDISNERFLVSFPIRLKSGFERVCGLFVSNDNEILVVTTTCTSDTVVLLYVYTQEEGLKRTAQLRHASSKVLYKVSFDFATKNYILCSVDMLHKILHVECISETGELRNSLFLDGKYIVDEENLGFLISRTSGSIALVNPHCVFYFRLSSM